MNLIMKIAKSIDKLTEKIAFLSQFLTLVLIFVTVYSVTCRYFLRMPDIRTFYVSIWLYGILFLLGCAYDILVKRHTIIDLLYMHLSSRGKVMLDWISLFATLLLCILLIPISASKAWYSYLINEQDSTMIEYTPTIWWYKFLVIFVLISALLQVLSQIFKQIFNIKSKQSEI